MAHAQTAVMPPAAAFDALGIVDLNEPGPSGTVRDHALSHMHPAHTDLSADALGLPPDAQIIRVPEGERYRVRAVYDFEATDESALSFRAGDVIEVLTMLPSGWWDGMLGTSRGWFPSNYVEDADDDLYDDADDDRDDDDDDDYVEMAHDGSVVHRNGAAADVLGPPGMAWSSNHWARDSSTSLDDLPPHERSARTTAQEHPGRTDRHNQHRRNSPSPSDDPDRAFLALPSPPPRGGAAGPGTGAAASGAHTDAWVPSLTSDGRVCTCSYCR